MKLAVIGAGSTYTPELVSGLARERLDIGELVLHDIDRERREVVGAVPAGVAVEEPPAPQTGDQSGQSGQGADIRDAGNAQSLASNSASNDVQLPMLIAVIVLAGVTAGLVRTWVLRRAA